jgi:hypothetical protein
MILQARKLAQTIAQSQKAKRHDQLDFAKSSEPSRALPVLLLNP